MSTVYRSQVGTSRSGRQRGRVSYFDIASLVGITVQSDGGNPFDRWLTTTAMELDFFRTTDPRRTDMVIEYTSFKPDLRGCMVVDDSAWVRPGYIYFEIKRKGSHARVEIRDEQSQPLFVRISSNSLGEHQTFGHVIEPLIALLLENQGCVKVHAAAVAREEVGLLISGTGGSGKTSSALEFVKRGFAFLGDDSAVLRNGNVLAFPKWLHVFRYRLDSATPFDENLTFGQKAQTYLTWLLSQATSGFAKLFTFIGPASRIHEQPPKHETRLGTVFFLEPGSGETALERISCDETASRIAANDILELRHLLTPLLAYEMVAPGSRIAVSQARHRSILRNMIREAECFLVRYPIMDFGVINAMEKVLKMPIRNTDRLHGPRSQDETADDTIKGLNPTSRGRTTEGKSSPSVLIPMNWTPSAEAGGAGGVRYYVEALVDYLTQQGVNVTLACAGATRLSERVVSIPITTRLHTNFTFDFLLLFRAARIGRYDVVHSQSPAELFPFLIAPKQTRRICTLHADYSRIIRELYGPLVALTYRVVETLSLKFADAVMAVDSRTAQLYEKRYPWLSNRLEITPTIASESVFRPIDMEDARRRLDIDMSYRVLLFVGRLEPEKNVLDLIEAASILRSRGVPVMLILVGKGRLRGQAEHRARELGLAEVRFEGLVPHEMIPIFMGAADLLVLCSSTEASPTVLKEAAYCGLPIVSTDVGDAPTLLTAVPSISLEIAESSTPGSLADAIAHSISRPTQDRLLVAKQARQFLSAKESLVTTVRLYGIAGLPSEGLNS